MKEKKLLFRIVRAFRVIPGFAAVILLCFVFSLKAKASGELDEILNYEIRAEVNEDTTVRLTYHIDWKVLDSDSEGPLSWVKIGIPNRHCLDMKALSGNIKDIRYSGENGSFVKITFDREYYKDEVISFDFFITQDYMYEMNLLTDGETVFQFTPGWFDDINVDKLVIHWKADNTIGISPAALMDGEYYTWETSLPKGTQFQVNVTYPNDAYPFSKDKNVIGKTKSEVFRERYGKRIIIFLVIAGCIVYIVGFKFIADLIGWVTSAGFSKTKKAIRRTVIEYYPNCPGCGAPRPEGLENCEYCGMNFVKSEKIVEEKKIPKKYKDFKEEIFNHKRAGTYKVDSSPNTYVRVASIIVPHRTSFASYVKEHQKLTFRGGGGHSGCAHSSCACACACACAGGGRAGCTAKDFYRTDLKMEYFKEKDSGKGQE